MSFLTLEQARRETLWLNMLGWMVGVLSAFVLVVVLLKSVHAMAAEVTTPADVALMAPLRRAIEALVAIPVSIAPRVTALVWHMVPNWDWRAPLIAAENAGAIAVYFVMLLSMVPRGRATRLRRAIAEHQHRMQQLYWEEAAREALRGGVQPAEMDTDCRSRCPSRTRGRHGTRP